MGSINRLRTLLSAAGIDPRQGPAETAALLVRQVPLRAGSDAATGPEAIVEGGWCSGVEAFAQLMETVTGQRCRWGSAFGGRWPFFDVVGAVVAPGLPVRVGPGMEETGPDGAYLLDGDTVTREAGGRRGVFLFRDESSAPIAPAFRLLWFSDTARFLLKENVVEIEDLFSRVCCPINHSGLEHLLVRGRRINSEVIEGLSFKGDPPPTTVEVAREHGGLTGDPPEAEAFLASRIDVDDCSIQGDRVLMKDVRGETVEFMATRRDDGWTLEKQEGRFPYEALRLRKAGRHHVLTATIAAGHDLLSPGVRGRFVFDLNADLMSVQKS